ncbi:MAG: class II aldolase/adducin family protein, partial [Pseudomonadota bacterium]
QTRDHLDDLRTWSAKLGADPSLVQGGGGNTSIKSGGRLLVKASGTWLADALVKDIFVDVELATLKAETLALRPSIETALHALMPHPCVMHAHPISVIAATVRADGDMFLKEALDGFDWRLVPYRKPGADLAEACAAALADGRPDILILQNHGLVVGADTPEEAFLALEQVSQRLERPSRLQATDASQYIDLDGYAPSKHPLASAVAQCPQAAAALSAGALVPDQVVYLGGPVPAIAQAHHLETVRSRWQTARGVAPTAVLLRGHTVYVERGAGEAARLMVAMLIEVAAALPADQPVRTLSLQDELALLNWEAEAHRQSVDQQREKDRCHG